MYQMGQDQLSGGVSVLFWRIQYMLQMLYRNPPPPVQEQDALMTHECGNKAQICSLSIKINVKVIRSLILMSFERTSLLFMCAKYEFFISYGSKIMAKVKAFSPQIDRWNRN